MQPEDIEVLIELAISAFTKQAQSSEYAHTAAHKAAHIAAYRHHPDLADFAAFHAATHFLQDVRAAIHFSARITDAANNRLLSNNAYNAEWQMYSITNLPISAQQGYFASMAEKTGQKIQDFSDVVSPIYDRVSVLDVAARNKARRAAQYVYRDTFAVTRAAYVRAMFIASQTQDETKRQSLFTQAIRRILHDDLSYDIIYPSMLLRLLNKRAILVLAGILLLLGIGAILFGVFHVLPFPMITMICAGGGAIALSASAYIGRFFAHRMCRAIGEANANRAETCLFP